MSPPAQKPRRPAPSRITVATAGLASNSSSACPIPRIIASVSALSAAGRFSVILPARPSRRTISSLPAAVSMRAGSALPAEERAGHDQPHDFVGPLQDLVHAEIAHDL